MEYFYSENIRTTMYDVDVMGDVYGQYVLIEYRMISTRVWFQ